MLLIEGARVVDVEHGIAEPADWVVLNGGLLTPFEQTRFAPQERDCQRIAAGGQYLTPGLIDAHVHLGRPKVHLEDDWGQRQVAEGAKRTLRGGVTTVRDLGDSWARGLRIAAQAKALNVPRVVNGISGLTAPDSYGRFLGETVRDVIEMREAIRRRFEAGAMVIKLFLTGGVNFATGAIGPVHFDSDALRQAVETAHRLGLSVAVHANGPAAVQMAVLAGVDSIEHGILSDESNLKAMADCGTFWVPTLTPLWQAVQPGKGSPKGDMDPARAILRCVFEQHQESVAKAFDMGIRVLTGTDAGAPSVPHGQTHKELALFVAAGVQPGLALKAATVWTAAALAVSQHTGSIGQGKQADLLILNSNPLVAPPTSANVEWVIAGGEVVVSPQAP